VIDKLKLWITRKATSFFIARSSEPEMIAGKFGYWQAPQDIQHIPPAELDKVLKSMRMVGATKEGVNYILISEVDPAKHLAERIASQVGASK